VAFERGCGVASPSWGLVVYGSPTLSVSVVTGRRVVSPSIGSRKFARRTVDSDSRVTSHVDGDSERSTGATTEAPTRCGRRRDEKRFADSTHARFVSQSSRVGVFRPRADRCHECTPGSRGRVSARMQKVQPSDQGVGRCRATPCQDESRSGRSCSDITWAIRIELVNS